MVWQVALGYAGVARGTLPHWQPVPGDETQGILSWSRAACMASVVWQITSPAWISSSGQHRVRGKASSGTESYSLQWKGSTDLSVLECDEFDPVQTTNNVSLWTNVETASAWPSQHDQSTWLHARSRLLLDLDETPTLLSFSVCLWISPVFVGGWRSTPCTKWLTILNELKKCFGDNPCCRREDPSTLYMVQNLNSQSPC